jgi:hypothetical protein
MCNEELFISRENQAMSSQYLLVHFMLLVLWILHCDVNFECILIS